MWSLWWNISRNLVPKTVEQTYEKNSRNVLNVRNFEIGFFESQKWKMKIQKEWTLSKYSRKILVYWISKANHYLISNFHFFFSISDQKFLEARAVHVFTKKRFTKIKSNRILVETTSKIVFTKKWRIRTNLTDSLTFLEIVTNPSFGNIFYLTKKPNNQNVDTVKTC